MKTYFHRSACAIAALATVLLIWMFPSQQTTRVMIISYDSNSPALTAIIYPDGYCRIADIPDHKTALLAGKLLARSGVRHANVSFSSGTAKSAKGTQTLAKTIFLTVNTPTGKKQPTRRFRQYMLSDNICKTNAPGTIQLDLSAQKTLTCRTPDGIEITTTATDNGRFAKIKSASGTEYCNTLVWASLPTVWMCEIK